MDRCARFSPGEGAAPDGSFADAGELAQDEDHARDQGAGAYIEVIGGRMDMPPILAFAHGRLGTMYGDTS
jgi:hypothetical protein